AGEPVMMQVNDYNRMVFNGDQGLVLNVSDGSPPRLMAVFPRPDGYGIFHLDSLRPVLRHSYAMTVHKSQGSEFDRVALVLPDRDLPINTREVLYTALTRSRTSVVLVGDRNLFEQGVAREIRRDSGIAEKLEARPQNPMGHTRETAPANDLLQARSASE
ncbi:ATP-dependent DNA helicase, partial [Singulisphaera rosea]